MPIDVARAAVRPVDADLAKLRLRGGISALSKIHANVSEDSIEAKKARIRTRLLDELAEQGAAREEVVQRRTGKLIALADIRRPIQVQRILRAFRLALQRLEAGSSEVQTRDVMLVRDPSEQTPHTRGYELAAPEQYRPGLIAKALPDQNSTGGRVDILLGGAKHLLGEHRRDDGTASDPTSLDAVDAAAMLLMRAAMQGSREAQGRLEALARHDHRSAVQGLVRVHASRTPADFVRVRHYAEHGVRLGIIAAHDWLGEIREFGRDGSPNLALALTHYETIERAYISRTSTIDVSHKLARAFAKPGPTQNNEQAKRFLLIAAERGHVDSALAVAGKYFDRPGACASTAAWARTVQTAAEAGNRSALCVLGVAHSKGCFTDSDDAVAFRYLHKAAELGHGAAAFVAGEHYEAGRGVTKNLKNALRAYRVAAKYDNPDAIRLLSHRSMLGIGMPQNIEKGLAYLKRAADLGDPQAAQLYADAQG